MTRQDGGPTTQPDWELIAGKLAGGLLQAITHLKVPSGSCFMDIKTGKSVGAMEHFAQILETHPGVKVDREMLHINQMPFAKRRKALAARKARNQGEGRE